MDPDAQYQQNLDELRKNNNLQEQDNLTMQFPIQNLQQNQVVPLMVQQEQQFPQNFITDINTQQLQMQLYQQQQQIQLLQMQNQMQAQMQQNQRIVENQDIRNEGERNELHTYTTLFSEKGINVREIITQVAKNMIQNCGFKIEGVQLRNNLNLYQDKIPHIIKNKIVQKLKEVNPDVEEKKYKESKIIRSLDPLFNTFFQKWKTAYFYSIVMVIFQWTYLLIVIFISQKFYEDNWLSWLGVVEGLCTLFNLGASVQSKRKFVNKPVRLACKVSIMFFIFHLFGFYNMFAEGTMQSDGALAIPVFFIVLISMFFCIQIKGFQYSVFYELEQVFQRIFVIIGEDPIDNLEK